MKKKSNFSKIFLILIEIILAAWLALFCIIFIYSFFDNTQKSDAIIVLGAAQWDGQPSPMFQARLDHAYNLYEQAYAPVIVLTGGVGEGQTISEADTGAKYLQNRGISSDALLVDPYGRTTLKSLISAADKIKQNNIKSSILVSHDFHNLRLEKMAEDIHISAVVSPVKSNNFFSKLRYIARESIVYIVYILFDI